MSTLGPAQNSKNGLFEESWLKELGRNTSEAWYTRPFVYLDDS